MVTATQGNGTAPAPEAQPKTVEDLIKECREGRESLAALAAPLFTTLWIEALRCIKELLPHQQGDGSPNERVYQAYRRRILNCGNSQARDHLPNVISDFYVAQLRTREVVVRTVQGHGIHNLPPGVRMPSEK